MTFAFDWQLAFEMVLEGVLIGGIVGGLVVLVIGLICVSPEGKQKQSNPDENESLP